MPPTTAPVPAPIATTCWRSLIQIVEFTMLRRLSARVAVLVAGACVAHAQGANAGSSFGRSEPAAIILASASQSCLDRVPASALHRTVVYASVELPDSNDERFRATIENFLQDVALRVAPLLGHSRDSLVRAEPAMTWRGLGAPLRVVWYAGGRLSWRVDPGEPLGADTAAAALLGRAVKATLADGGDLVAYNGAPQPDSLVFRFELEWPQTAVDGRVIPPTFRHTALPVFTIDYPTVQQAAFASRSTVMVHPMGAGDRGGHEGSVMLEFMVDTTGRAEPATIRDVWPPGTPRPGGVDESTYQNFVAVSREVIERSHFLPARIGGCAVRQRVRMPFAFTGRR
jgi:hypothetical protein